MDTFYNNIIFANLKSERRFFKRRAPTFVGEEQIKTIKAYNKLKNGKSTHRPEPKPNKENAIYTRAAKPPPKNTNYRNLKSLGCRKQVKNRKSKIRPEPRKQRKRNFSQSG